MAGAGLGLRRAFLDELLAAVPPQVDLFEVAPENWMALGGRLGRSFRALTERHRFVAHGLSLNLGGSAPLDEDFVRAVGDFLDAHGIADYSEHLAYCADHGLLYDLAPIPFTAEAARHVALRVRRVQDLLGRRIALENISYYAAPGRELGELAFVNAVLQEADCDLLLDVNNVAVNAVNHGYDALAFIDGLPLQRVRGLHVAGHLVAAPDLCVDTHGAAVAEGVWALLEHACARLAAIGRSVPAVLERDFDFPPLAELAAEAGRIGAVQARHAPLAAPPQPPSRSAAA